MELIATAESERQAEMLLDAGVDTLYIGEDEFGLRLPHSFSQAEVKELTETAHRAGKKVYVAVNAIMHNDRIRKVVPYLEFLQDVGVDAITVGDPGVIHLMRKQDIRIPFIYDAQTLVTSARQINFWVKRGATGAVLARELTFEEIQNIQAQTAVPLEVQVYGATCIHQSKRPLVSNYLSFTGQKRDTTKGLYVAELKQPDFHYSIYEDVNGTHIFEAKDLNLMPYLGDLAEAGLTVWKLDGIFTPGEAFVAIARLFAEAKAAIQAGEWTQEKMESLNRQLEELHPKERSLGTGFFLKHASEVN